LPDINGRRRDVVLGKYDTPESRAEYARVIGEWEANGRRLAALTAQSTDATVNELIIAFYQHAEKHYRRPDGAATSELSEYRRSFGRLWKMYGHTPARDFRPLALKAIREKMIHSGLARGVINQRIDRIKRAFKWGVDTSWCP
jgi:hypothetical protein